MQKIAVAMGPKSDSGRATPVIETLDKDRSRGDMESEGAYRETVCRIGLK